MIDPAKVKDWLKEIIETLGSFETDSSEREVSDIAQDALEYIALLEERVAIMAEGKEIKYVPEKGKLYDQEYWLCGCCNEPIEIGTVERKHLRNYCYLCGAKIDKGEENEDQR